MNNISHFRTAKLRQFHEIEPEIFVPRDQIPESALSAEANTLGWDIVQAIRLPQVNKTLEKYPPPPPFNYKVQDDWHLSGEFTFFRLNPHVCIPKDVGISVG